MAEAPDLTLPLLPALLLLYEFSLITNINLDKNALELTRNVIAEWPTTGTADKTYSTYTKVLYTKYFILYTKVLIVLCLG